MRMVLPILLLFGVTPLAAAQDKPTMVVRDANGNLVGTVLAQADDQAGANAPTELTDRLPLWVARWVAGTWIVLPVSQSTVWATKDLTPFLYETRDCSGPALLDAPRTGNEASATVLFDTGIYWAAGPGEERVIRSQGVRLADPGRQWQQCGGMLLEGNLCCTVPAQEETRFAAEAPGIPLAQLGLHAPFRLETATAPPAR